MPCFRAVISYYLILFRPIPALQVAAIENLFHFCSSPVALGQICFVLVLISTNHNARYLYPEMDMSRTANRRFTDHCQRDVTSYINDFKMAGEFLAWPWCKNLTTEVTEIECNWRKLLNKHQDSSSQVVLIVLLVLMGLVVVIVLPPSMMFLSQRARQTG